MLILPATYTSGSTGIEAAYVARIHDYTIAPLELQLPYLTVGPTTICCRNFSCLWPTPALLLPQLSASPPPLRTQIIPPYIYKHSSAILVELCTSKKELHQFLPLVIKNDHYNEHLFQTKLLSLFCKFNSLNDAIKFFEPIEHKVDPMYHTLLKAHASQLSLDVALRFLIRMKHDGVEPVVYNFSYLMKACADDFDARRGKEVQAQLVVNGFSSNLFAMTSVMNLYAKCRVIEEAYKVFDRMLERDFVCWNTVVASFLQNGMPERAMGLVRRMGEEGESPDLVTVISVLLAVAST